MGTRLYVGNLPFSADEQQVRDLFEQNGRTVTEVKLITDRDTGRSRVFGFVTMVNDEYGERAMNEMDGAELDGRQIRVNEAEQKSGGGGGGGGRGGRGGRGGGGGGGNRW